MEKNMLTTTMVCIYICIYIGFGFRIQGLEGTGKTTATTIMGYIGTVIVIHSFMPTVANQR